MKLLAVICVLWLAASVTRAGSIHGTVRAKGKEGTDDSSAGGGAYASRKFKFADKVDYDNMRDFIVYIKGPIPGTKAPEATNAIHQKDAAFVPHVLPVMVGTKVTFPNDDEIFHNVFSKSDAKEFDLELYKKGDQPGVVIFDKPGEVDVFCSIHTRMSCVVLVLENPCFALTDNAGRFVITNIPPGHYTLVAWHERLPNKEFPITITGAEEQKLDITMMP